MMRSRGAGTVVKTATSHKRAFYMPLMTPALKWTLFVSRMCLERSTPANSRLSPGRQLLSTGGFLSVHLSICLRHFPLNALRFMPLERSCPRPDCSWAYTQPVRLRAHLASVHGEETLRALCVHCGKSYTRQDELQRHIKKEHDSQKRFICRRCGVSFKEKRVLSRHLKNKRCGGLSWEEDADEEIVPSNAAESSAQATSRPSRASLTVIHSAQRRLTGSPLRVDYLDGSTFDDYLAHCQGFAHSAIFFLEIEETKGDLFKHIVGQYNTFFTEHYIASLEICRKLLAFLHIKSPDAKTLFKLPRNILRDLGDLAWGVNYLAQIVDDEVGLERHDEFRDATHEAYQAAVRWEKYTQREDHEIVGEEDFVAVMTYLPNTMKTLMKQVLDSCGGRISDQDVIGAGTSEWYMNEEGEVTWSWCGNPD
jgi:uncharacterized C2H2 Zn-finger protein